MTAKSRTRKTLSPKNAKPDAEQKTRLITAEDLRRFHLIGNQQISPDAAQILFVKRHVEEPNKQISNLWLVDTKTGKSRQFTSGNKDAMGFWSPCGRKVAFVSGRDKGKAQIYLISAEGGEARALTKFPQGSIAGFEWAPDGNSLAVLFREQDPDFTDEARKQREEKGLSDPPRVIDDVMYRLDGDGYFNRQRYALYQVTVPTGETRKFFDQAPNGINAFSWSPDSRDIVIAANLDPDGWQFPEKCRLHRITVATGKVQVLPGQKDGLISRAVWSPDGTMVAFTGQMGKKDIWAPVNHQLYLYKFKTGKVESLTGSMDLCLEAALLGDSKDAEWSSPILWSPDSHHVYFEARWHGTANLARVDVRSGSIESCTSGEHVLTIGNVSKDGRHFALRCGDETNLEEVTLGSWTRGAFEARVLTHFNHELISGLSLSAPECYWVPANDGSETQVWVMRPPNFKPGRKYPAILEIHGGPHAQYGCTFFHEFQLLAAQGYIVFYSNPRGSKGYGEKHCTSIKGDWGNLDWLDLQAVISFMFGMPEVDTKRLGVMGGSYGGYMTNWIITHTDVFRAAITDRCVSNLVSMSGSSDYPNIPDSYWPGNGWSEIEALWNQSPIRYFDEVKTPTLIIHSEGDLRCNIEQAEQVYMALKIRGIPTRFVRYPASTSHGMSRNGPPDLRVHRLNQILEWWKKYL